MNPPCHGFVAALAITGITLPICLRTWQTKRESITGVLGAAKSLCGGMRLER